MKLRWKLLLGTSALLVAGIATGIWLIAGTMMDDLCEAETIITLPSPEGAFVASVEQGSCGATTGIFTRVVILGKEGRASNAALVFIADGVETVHLSWQDNHSLLIDEEASKVFRRENTVRGVVIRYESIARKGH